VKQHERTQSRPDNTVTMRQQCGSNIVTMRVMLSS